MKVWVEVVRSIAPFIIAAIVFLVILGLLSFAH